MKRLIIIILTVLLALNSCTTTYQVTSRYPSDSELIGLNRTEIETLFGVPSHISPQAETGKYILTYENNTTYFDYDAKYNAASGTVPTVHFMMDTQNICYKITTSNTRTVEVYDAQKTWSGVLGFLVFDFLAGLIYYLANY